MCSASLTARRTSSQIDIATLGILTLTLHQQHASEHFFDGSVRSNKAAFGWIVLACPGGDHDREQWSIIASKSGSLPDGATITAAELEGSLSLVSFLHAYYQSYEKARSNICDYSLMPHNTIHSLLLADLV